MENKELYDSSASLYVLSTLMRKPLLLEDDKYAVLQTDFGDSLQQIVFISIYNLAKKGVSTITPSDIDLYLKTTPSQYDYYREHKGYDYVLLTYKTTEGSDLKQFDFYYERLKKFSLLRDLEKNGINIKDFYDTSKDFLDRDLEDERLNNIKLQEIPNAIREKLVEIENKHLGKLNATAQEASKGLKELVADLKKNPEIGLPLDGKILNFAIRGARLGKLYLYSAASGMGKTRTMVGNACQIAMPFIKGGKIQVRDGYQKVLFMATEMAADEIQTLVLACVSGVNEEKILLGTCNPEEEKTIDEAIAIIEKYKDNFIIESMPDPSMAAIRARLTKYILQDGISYIFYDYIFSSPGLLGEFRDIDVREDVALMMLSNTLKEIAMTYNVFIMSATQLNGGWDKPGPRTANLIRGSKAISDWKKF